MALSYFGPTGASGDDDNGSKHQLNWLNTTYVCPGTGNQILKELSVYCKIGANYPEIRVGIYTAAGVLVAQGTALVTVTGSSYSWQGHLVVTNITPNPCVLTGGTAYRLAYYTTVNDTCTSQYETGGTNAGSYLVDTDYSASLPATFPSPTGSWTGMWNIRAGVEAEGAAAIGPSGAIVSAEDVDGAAMMRGTIQSEV